MPRGGGRGRAAALLTLTILLVLTAAGCGSKPKPKEPPKEEKKEEVKIPDQSVGLGRASSTQYGGGKDRKPQWYIEWEKAKIDISQGGAENARMEGVSGYIYKQDAKPGQRAQNTTFRADGGLANKTDEVLMLRGNVRVVSSEPKATLTCDRLLYDAKKKRIQAIGHVKVVGEVGTIGTLSELWATHDLKVVATPDMFNGQ